MCAVQAWRMTGLGRPTGYWPKIERVKEWERVAPEGIEAAKDS